MLTETIEDFPWENGDEVEKGQRIVHGLLDVLKLNLVQISCLALLIAAIQVASIGFPYASAQGAAIAAITVTLQHPGSPATAVACRLPGVAS